MNEHLQLLGENYTKQMKRDLTPLTFQTSILCKGIGIAKNGFYSSMRERHKYDANNADLILAIQSAGVSRGRNGFFTSKAPRQ